MAYLHTIVLTLLALVSFLLLTEWRNDSLGKQKKIDSAQHTDQLRSEPQASDTPAFITVSTDVLKLKIAKHGGDILFLSLLKYRRLQDTPDEPFVLLKNEPQQSYVTQSGLSGMNGIDKQNNRAKYQTIHNSFSLKQNLDKL